MKRNIELDNIGVYCIKCKKNMFRSSFTENRKEIDLVFYCLKCNKEVIVEIENE